jgi:hypothetical protein
LQQSLKNLTHLDLFNNDVCNSDDYRAKVFKMLPSLKVLDDTDVDGNDADDSDWEDGQNGTLDEEGSDDGEGCGVVTGRINLYRCIHIQKYQKYLDII